MADFGIAEAAAIGALVVAGASVAIAASASKASLSNQSPGYNASVSRRLPPEWLFPSFSGQPEQQATLSGRTDLPQWRIPGQLVAAARAADARLLASLILMQYLS